jgi:hypothetical protein
MTWQGCPAPVPARMQGLAKDRRGLPIPVIVLRDAQGAPHFTMNDQRAADRCAQLGLCAICGQTLGAHKCFVGGPGSAFHPQGRYFDGPMHRDCAIFALRTCPYLALPSYARRVGTRTLRPESVGDGRVLVTEDPTSHAPQPAVFVLGSCKRYRRVQRHYVPERPWVEVRYFQGGSEITAAAAKALAEADPTPAAPFSELAWP